MRFFWGDVCQEFDERLAGNEIYNVEERLRGFIGFLMINGRVIVKFWKIFYRISFIFSDF